MVAKLVTRSRFSTVVGVLVALTVALPAITRGAVNGLPVDPPRISCSNWLDGSMDMFIVSPPSFQPLVFYDQLVLPDGTFVVPGQWVGYRVTIYYKATDGRYYPYPWGRGALMQTYDANAMVDTTGADWYNADAKSWAYTSRNFPIYHHTWFKVWVEYYWYANRYLPSASTGAWVQWLDGAWTDPSACHF